MVFDKGSWLMERVIRDGIACLPKAAPEVQWPESHVRGIPLFIHAIRNREDRSYVRLYRLRHSARSYASRLRRMYNSPDFYVASPWVLR